MTGATLAIQAGGEGARMGRPKATLVVDELPILEFLLKRLSWKGPTMLVTAPGREHPPGWELFDREVTDPVSGVGPLRGILTALENAPTDLIVFATVDMPLITCEQLRWLVSQFENKAGRKGLMTTRVEARGEIIEPFPSAFRRSIVRILQMRLDQGLRSVHSLKDEPGIECIAAPAHWPVSVWTNLNHPGDYETFLRGSH